MTLPVCKRCNKEVDMVAEIPDFDVSYQDYLIRCHGEEHKIRLHGVIFGGFWGFAGSHQLPRTVSFDVASEELRVKIA